MNDQNTSRFALPYLFSGQAQKEMTHNEALIAIDALLHPIVEETLNTPPALLNTVDAGKCWHIGNAPSGLWQNRARQIANWSGSSWRFVIPQRGMKVFNRATGVYNIFEIGNWVEPASIMDPIQGNIIDLEARSAISAILGMLRETAVIPA